MKFIEFLKENTLTEKEKLVLNEIHSQGDFYETSIRYDGFDTSAFLGYKVTKKDFNNEFNPDGVISSLVKKGILEVGDPIGDGSIGYWIKYELDFDDNENIIFE